MDIKTGRLEEAKLKRKGQEYLSLRILEQCIWELGGCCLQQLLWVRVPGVRQGETVGEDVSLGAVVHESDIVAGCPPVGLGSG